MMLRAGIIGCGRIGCGFDDDPLRKYVSTHARAYFLTPEIELAALCDSDITKLQHFGDKFNVPGRYADYAKMLESERLDIVSICTPSRSHLEIACAAADSGVRGIVCEKPIASTLADAEEMIRLCEERKVVLMIGHQRRFDPMHQRLAHFIRTGGLGGIQQVTCYYTAGVANTGTHLFDLLRFYLGDVSWVEGRFSGNKSHNAKDPNLDGWLGFVSGGAAAIQSCDVSSYTIFEVVMLGTNGRLRIDSHGFHAEYEEVRASERYSGYRELFSAPVPVAGEFTQSLLDRGIFHLIKCMRTGAIPVSSGEDGRAALEIVFALGESAHGSGKQIHLPLTSNRLAVASR